MPFKKGYKQTEEHKKKIGEANKGKFRTEETKEKMSKAQTREKSHRWNGGFNRDANGYLLFKVPEGCKFSSMKNCDGYIKVNRLLMAEYLQRPLTSEETIHHINGDVTDDRIENLRLFENRGKHVTYHNKLRKEEEK